MMDKKRAQYLLERYHRQTCTPEEQAEFALLLHDVRLNAFREQWLDDYWAQISETDAQTFEPANYQHVLSEIKQQPSFACKHPVQHKNRLYIRRWLHYVAALALIVMAITWYIVDQSKKSDKAEPLIAHIIPGSHRATLTLADGLVIPLSEAQTGIVIGKDIHYLDGSRLDSVVDLHNTPILSLATPRGGTYQLTLPDGTKVWLNAATQLRYPSQFSGSERVVELDGEAYFEVSRYNNAQGVHMPFIVRSHHQRVEVLGTHFNISAYRNDPNMKTTLVEGKVKIATAKAATLLHPGEQGVLQGEQLSKQKVDVSIALAWVHGDIVFDQVSLPEIFRQLERWYDVRFDFDRPLPQVELYGKLSRQANLSEILRTIESSTHLRFNLVHSNEKERRIRVY